MKKVNAKHFGLSFNKTRYDTIARELKISAEVYAILYTVRAICLHHVLTNRHEVKIPNRRHKKHAKNQFLYTIQNTLATDTKFRHRKRTTIIFKLS